MTVYDIGGGPRGRRLEQQGLIRAGHSPRFSNMRSACGGHGESNIIRTVTFTTFLRSRRRQWRRVSPSYGYGSSRARQWKLKTELSNETTGTVISESSSHPGVSESVAEVGKSRVLLAFKISCRRLSDNDDLENSRSSRTRTRRDPGSLESDLHELFRNVNPEPRRRAVAALLVCG